MNFRQLNANELECRVGQTNCNPTKNTYGCSLLIYKTARVDANILDETVGAENWSVDHFQVKDKDFARLGLKIGNEWIYKADCGSESNVEKEKGESSDALKRAAFLWGIGRALYSAPHIWINLTEKDFYNGKLSPFVKFSVSEIAYDVNGNICKLKIVRDDTKKVVYDETWGTPVEQFDAMASFNALKTIFKDTVIIKQIFGKYGVSRISELTQEKMDLIVSELVKNGIGIIDNKK